MLQSMKLRVAGSQKQAMLSASCFKLLEEVLLCLVGNSDNAKNSKLKAKERGMNKLQQSACSLPHLEKKKRKRNCCGAKLHKLQSSGFCIRRSLRMASSLHLLMRVRVCAANSFHRLVLIFNSPSCIQRNHYNDLLARQALSVGTFRPNLL